MLKIDNFRYKAEEGKFIIRKSDNVIMGESICLGINDDIKNYKEKAYTKKSYKEFYESLGINVEKKEMKQTELKIGENLFQTFLSLKNKK